MTNVHTTQGQRRMKPATPCSCLASHPHVLVHTSFFDHLYLLHTHWVHGPTQALVRDNFEALKDQPYSVASIIRREEGSLAGRQERQHGSCWAIGGQKRAPLGRQPICILG